MRPPRVQRREAVVFVAAGTNPARRRLTERAAYGDAAASRIIETWCPECTAFEHGCRVRDCVGERYGRLVWRLARMLYRIDHGHWPKWRTR